MNITNLHDEFNAMLADRPDPTAVRDTVRVGAARHHKRRRTAALLASGVAVVVITGTVWIGSSEVGRVQAPAQDQSWMDGPAATVAAGSALVPYRMQEVFSPVSTSAQGPGTDQMSWSSSGATVNVSWSPPPGPDGSVLTRPNTSDPLTSALSSARGYYVTSAANLAEKTSTSASSSPQPDQIRTTTVQVNNRTAVLSRAPIDIPPGIGSNQWVSWQLSDGRYIHVWVDNNDAKVLLAFADTFSEDLQLLPQHLTIGLTPQGMTATSISNDATATTLLFNQISLCRPTTDPAALKSGFGFGPGPNPCIRASVVNKDMISTTTLPAPAPVDIKIGDLTVHTYPTAHVAYADIGNFAAIVRGPDIPTLSSADLAAAVASVKIDPTMAVGHFTGSLNGG